MDYILSQNQRPWMTLNGRTAIYSFYL